MMRQMSCFNIQMSYEQFGESWSASVATAAFRFIAGELVPTVDKTRRTS